MAQRTRILCFASYFLPGFRAGGPIRSLQRSIETLEADFEFSVVTRDRDLGVDAPYPVVACNQWTEIQGIRVWYLTRPYWSPAAYRQIIATCAPELLYFHS